MRILHLTTLLQGGAGRAITDLACQQHEAGHWVDVVTSRTAPDGYGNYPGHLDQLRDAGVDLHLVDSTFSRDVADNLQVTTYLLDRALLSGTSVVHAHAATPALVALIARGMAGRRVPIVQSMHGWGTRKNPSQQRADVAVMNAVDGLVVPAPSSAAVLRDAGVVRSDIGIVPYGVAERESGPASVEVMRDIHAMRAGGRTVFTCVGTIGDRKNQASIVEAIARIAEPARLVCLFVGDGDAASLQACADRAGVADSIRILGYRADAPEIARASDWFVLPSRSEGQPLSIIEAFRDGVPVMASRIPELEELVQDDSTGLLFAPDDPDALAARLTDAMNMPRERTDMLVSRARARFESTFTLPAMVEGYFAQYAAARTQMHAVAGAAA